MKISQVALQIFTVREHFDSPKTFADTMKQVRQIGYQAVQTYQLDFITPEEIKKIFDDEGLICCGIHESAEVIMKNPQQVIDNMNILGCKHTSVSSSVEHVNSPTYDMVLDFTEKFDTTGKVLKNAGKILTYHNHSGEFKKVNGKLILDLIYEKTDPVNIQAEIDTYWVQHGGGNNIEWIKKLRNRLPLMHIKDYGITGHRVPTFMEIGYGNLDWKNIIEEAQNSGCQWFIVEQDICPEDSLNSARKSFEYIKENLCE